MEIVKRGSMCIEEENYMEKCCTGSLHVSFLFIDSIIEFDVL